MLTVRNKNILLGVTGSIAAYKACDLIRALQKAGFGVDVVMTKEAKEFITPLTLQSLAQRKVYSEMFDLNIDFDVEHIELAKKPSVILVAPATANIIGKLASGIYDDLLTCVIAATKAKVIIAPAMNNNMYANPVVQDNIRKLKRLGINFIGPRVGKLVCGDVDWGCLEEIDKIVLFIKKLLK
ncbi:MAG: flavoprotein [Candidatus Omnitrophota bacterium]